MAGHLRGRVELALSGREHGTRVEILYIFLPSPDYAFWRNPPQSMARGTDGAKHAVPHPPSFRPCHVRRILPIIRRVARGDCQT